MTSKGRSKKGTVLLSVLGAALLIFSAVLMNIVPGRPSTPMVQQVTPADRTSNEEDNIPSSGPQWMTYPYESDPFLFPQDEGYHPEFTEEWWYVNAHVMDQNGNLYEIMVCFFKHGIVTASVLDVSSGLYLNTTQAFTDIKMSQGHLDVRFGANELYQIKGRPFTYQLNFNGPKFQMALELTSLQKPLIVNGNGLVPMGQGLSYYYSLTNMTAKGTLTVSSKQHEISGTAWMDRQWGYWNPRESWDWFSVQLDNGMQLVLYKVFGSDATGQIFLYMSVLDQQGRSYNINQTGERMRIVLDYNGYWQSPDTRQVYSSGWTVTVPELELKIWISPLKMDQEVLYYPAGSSRMAIKPFWEGGCAVFGSYQGSPVSGRAFVETSFDYIHVSGDLQVQIKQLKKEGAHLELVLMVEDKDGHSLDNVELIALAGSPYDGGKVLLVDHLSAHDNSTYYKGELPDPGDTSIFIMIDPNNRIAELDEGNNILMAFGP
jgi:predicted secreted hydrolase